MVYSLLPRTLQFCMTDDSLCRKFLEQGGKAGKKAELLHMMNNDPQTFVKLLIQFGQTLLVCDSL